MYPYIYQGGPMKTFFILFLMAFPVLSFARIHTSAIHTIDESINDSPHLLLLENGSVIFLSSENKEDLDFFKESISSLSHLEITTDDENNFISARSVSTFDHPEDPIGQENQEKELNLSYEPTVLNSLSDASAIFRKMRRNYQFESQCYNRAHIWTWEEYNRSSLKSKKYFLFFTSRYIRAYRYHWWFHVTPAVSVNGLGDRMLDRRYTTDIKLIKDWTDKFIYSKRSCPIVFKYNDYRYNQQLEHCYLIPVSMYFWQPRDIERRDRLGVEKTSFIRSEVNYAYWEAF
jgi:hypothetical protein